MSEIPVSTEAKEWPFVDFSTWDTEERPTIDYIVEGIIPRGVLAGLAGPGGTGKSMFLLQLAISLSIGRTFFESFPVKRPHKVMAYFGEDPDVITRIRYLDIKSAYNLTSSEIALLRLNFKLSTEQAEALVIKSGDGLKTTARYEYVRTKIDAFEPDFVIVDPKSRWGSVDENNNDQATQFVMLMEDLVKPHEGSILIAHHVKKSNKTDLDVVGVRGASAFADASRVFLNMAVLEQKACEALPNGRYVHIQTTKNNYGPGLAEPVTLQHSATGGVFVEVNASQAILAALAKTLANALSGTTGINRSALDDPKEDDAKEVAKQLREIDRGYKRKLDKILEFGTSHGLLNQEHQKTQGRTRLRISAV